MSETAIMTSTKFTGYVTKII